MYENVWIVAYCILKYPPTPIQICITVVTIALSGNSATETNAAVATTAAETTAQASSGGTRTITDMLGRIDDRCVDSLSRSEMAKEMAYAEQHSEVTQLTVYDTVLLGRKPHIQMSPTQNDYDIVKNCLERLGFDKFALRYCDRFLFLKEGHIARMGDSSIFTEELLHDIYNVEANVVDIDEQRLVVIKNIHKKRSKVLP